MMRFQNPLVFCLILSVAVFIHKKHASETSGKPTEAGTYLLTVERGAFHDDCFELTLTKVKYHPAEGVPVDQEKYTTFSEVALDSAETLKFFKEIEKKGFWELKDVYTETSSCTSQLKITLTANGKTKSVICNDYERGCHDLVKYIDQKVIDLEGNGLKRIYLPG
jgi:hypothetical protein